MSSTRKILIGLLLIWAIGVAGYRMHVMTRQREELRTVQLQIEQRTRELAVLRQHAAATQAELVAAEQQLAALPTPRAADPAHGAEINAWLGRLKKLKQLFADKPERSIPELALLTDDDWLRVARQAELDTEEHVRRALARARDAAKGKFEGLVASALTRYLKQTNGELPAMVFALEPYFDPPVDPAILGRYEMLTSGMVSYSSSAPGVAAIRESSANDPDYDSRWTTMSNGGGRRAPAPSAWIPGFEDQSRRAYAAYKDANKGANAGALEQVIPYFDPPLDPALAEKLIRTAREGGW
jgi:hypothetical protein